MTHICYSNVTNSPYTNTDRKHKPITLAFSLKPYRLIKGNTKRHISFVSNGKELLGKSYDFVCLHILKTLKQYDNENSKKCELNVGFT